MHLDNEDKCQVRKFDPGHFIRIFIFIAETGVSSEKVGQFSSLANHVWRYLLRANLKNRTTQKSPI